MSDHFVTLIPVDPLFVPPDDAQSAAAALLRELVPRADEIESSVEDVVQFHDCGGNFERVSCPECELEVATDSWGEWMSADFSDEGGFALRPFAMPCCGATVTLNDLAYDWPQGFSRYSLRAMNPSGAPDDRGRKKLEALLGCELRVVRQRI